MFQQNCIATQIEVRSGLPIDKCSGCHLATTLTKPNLSCHQIAYSIWGAVHQLVYCQRIKDNVHLKRVLNSCWVTISQELINGAVDQCFK